MCLARFAAKNVKNSNPPPTAVAQEAAATADPLKITGVGSAASQSPAVKAVQPEVKKVKPISTALQVGTPY
jgi:hypothetical protein